jgi:hypothetical protein
MLSVTNRYKYTNPKHMRQQSEIEISNPYKTHFRITPKVCRFGEHDVAAAGKPKQSGK